MQMWLGVLTVLSVGAFSAVESRANVVDLEYFKTYVNRENCAKDQRHYLACIAALDVLAAAVDSELNLKTQTTGNALLQVGKSQLAMNANNLKLIRQAREVTAANVDLNTSLLKQVFLARQKAKNEFRNDFEPAFYHFKIASNDVIAEILNYLTQTYPSKLDEDVWMGAINEYLHISVDPHSDWRSTEDTKKSIDSKEDEFIGLGVQFVESPLGATIQKVFKGSGADSAGLLSDDTILSANGQSLRGLRSDLIVKKIRGEVDGVIQLEILRNGKKMIVTTTRKKVVTPVVSHSILGSGPTSVGMVRLENFMYQEACEDVSEVLKKFNAQMVDQVILDLRGNGGGAIPIAECLAGLFIGPGKAIAYQDGRGRQPLPPASMGPALDRAKMMLEHEVGQLIEEAGTNIGEPSYQDFLETLRSPEMLEHLARVIELADNELSGIFSSGDRIYKRKLAVLIDGDSASASEMIAGAFKDLNRALIVGQTSYGKGSFQSIRSSYGRFQLWQTGGLFYQPSGSSNQTTGIKPHIEAYRDLEPSVVETYKMREKDVFLYPLEPRSIRNVVHNADQMDKLQAPTECLKSKDLKAAYKSTTTPEWKDMQVLTAAAALSCMK